MKRIISFAVVAIMAVSAVFSGLSEVWAVEKSKEVSIAFTHDMHSHLEATDDKGGIAKIKTIKEELEEKYPGTILVDGGDFSMGTPYQTLYEKEAFELQAMAEAGYDATTFGNHEFDYGTLGLANMLNTAAKYQEDKKMPALVGTNINWEQSMKNDKDAVGKLKKAFENYGVQDYTIVEKNGVSIALIGLMAEDARLFAETNSDVAFSDYVQYVKNIVKEIKQNNEADLIVALSHSGLDLDDWNASEDVKLANEVDGIDVIVSAHTHDTLTEVKKEGDTIIVASGPYARNVGHLVLEEKGGKYAVKDYKLIDLNKDVKEDKDLAKQVASFKNKVNRQFFSKYGYTFDELLTESDYDFTPIDDFAVEQKEDTLGNIIADSYIYAVEKSEGINVDAAFVTAGTVRESIKKGKITVADAFNVGSLGFGEDGEIGYPLVVCYLTGAEIRAAAEVDASISPALSYARLYPAGVGYTINDKRLILNRAYNVVVMGEDGQAEKIDDEKLYCVVTNYNTCNMLSLVEEQSKGLLSVTPKDKEGNPIKDFKKHIVKTSKNIELKEWYAFAQYLDSFEGNKIPAKYGQPDGRKVVESSVNPVKLLKDPSNVAVMVAAIIMIPIVILAGIIVYLVKRRHERRGYTKSVFSSRRSRGGYGRGYGRGYSNRRPNMKKRKLNLRGKGRSRF